MSELQISVFVIILLLRIFMPMLLSLFLMLVFCTIALWNDSIIGVIPLHGTSAGQICELAGPPCCRVFIFVATLLVEVSLALSLELGHGHMQ